MPAAIDFGKTDFQVRTSNSAVLPLGRKIEGPLQLKAAVNPDSTWPFILVFGVEFIQMVNDVEHPLKDTTFNAMAVVVASRT